MRQWPTGMPAWLAAISLMLSCAMISPKKPFWWDELNTFIFATDPSLVHAVGAIADQGDSAPPLYHIVQWLWTRVFPPAELSVRLLSAVAMSLALVVVWRVLARAFGLRAAAIATLSAFCLSRLVMDQVVEARFYGFFMLLAALALSCHGAFARDERPAPRWLLANAAVQAALPLTHAYGLLYAAAFGAASLASDLLAGRWRPRIYASFMVGWSAFLVWLPSFLWQMQLGKPHAWSHAPQPWALWRTYHFGLYWVAFLAVLLLGAMAARRWPRRPSVGPEARALMVLGGVLLAMPLVAWSISRWITPIYQDRYLLPSLLGLAIAFAWLARAVWAEQEELPSRWPLALATAVLVSVPLVHAWRWEAQPRPGMLDTTFGHADLAIATESPHLYMPRLHYAPHPERYVYVADLAGALIPQAYVADVADTKVMLALARHYPALAVETSDHFLRTHPRFLLLDEPWRLWSYFRLRTGYHRERLGEIDGATVFLIERQGPGAPQGTARNAKSGPKG